MEVFKLEAQPRTTTGKVLAKRMRKEGLVPAVIYGHGDNVMCTLNEKDLKALLITPKVYLIDLMLGGKVEHVVLKEVWRATQRALGLGVNSWAVYASSGCKG